jgi:flagellar biosynthesis protein FliP
MSMSSLAQHRSGKLVATIGRSGLVLIALILGLFLSAAASAQEVPTDSVDSANIDTQHVASSSADTPTDVAKRSSAFDLSQLPDLTQRQNLNPAIQIVVLLTVLSLAPAILVMMTSFTRMVIVLALLRQAMGTQQLPPNQVLIGLALFMTFLVMGPTLTRVNNEAVRPYMNGAIDQEQALSRGAVPVRDFMIKQIRYNKNDEDVLLFTEASGAGVPKHWGDVGTMTLVPAFILSELKTAFLMGFRIYLPFLIVDMVISSVLISMGMMMLPPSLISLPFKLLLFVLVDGWRLIAGSLIGSFIK